MSMYVGQPESMLAQVHGIRSDRTNSRYLGINPPEDGYHVTLPPLVPAQQAPIDDPQPSSFPKEMAQSTTGQVYIRMVGATPGTFGRMKRVVAKQKSNYGTLSIGYADIENSKMFRFRGGWMPTFYTGSIMDQRHMSMLSELGRYCYLQRPHWGDVRQLPYLTERWQKFYIELYFRKVTPSYSKLIGPMRTQRCKTFVAKFLGRRSITPLLMKWTQFYGAKSIQCIRCGRDITLRF
jgi:hypothetical protein